MDRTARILALAAQHGFDRAAALPLEKVWFHPEYHHYCAENLCGNFGVNWACPGGPGAAESWNRKRCLYNRAVLLQSHRQFPGGASAEEAEALRAEHHDRFLPLVQAVRASESRELQAFSAGRCMVCDSCTCPTAPCRHPEQCFPSVSGVGLDAARICALAGLPCGDYRDEITFLGMLMFRE